MFVLENRARFEGQWFDVVKVNEGGITVYGAIIGGILGGVAYGMIERLPVLRGLDAAAFGLLIGMAIGRIGDLINGEHIARVSSLPWAVKYTDPDSPGYNFSATPAGVFVARHPATTYEMIGDLLIIGIMALDLLEVPPQPSRTDVLHGRGAVRGHALRRELPAHRQRAALPQHLGLSGIPDQELDDVPAGGLGDHVRDRGRRARFGCWRNPRRETSRKPPKPAQVATAARDAAAGLTLRLRTRAPRAMPGPCSS